MPASTVDQPQWTTEDLVKFIITPLQAASVIQAAGPNFLDTSTPPIRIPEIADFDDPDWFHENEEITADAEATSGERVLLPATLKSVKGIARLSNELVRHSPLALLQAFQQQMTTRNAKKIDQAFINGTGTPDVNGNHTPKGLLNVSGIQTETWVSPPLTPDDVLDSVSKAAGKLLTAEIEDHSRVVLFVPTAWWVAADQVKDADDRPLLEADPQNPTQRRIKGYPVRPSSKMPADTGLMVDMSQVYVARDLNVQVKILQERYAEFDQVGVRVVARQDIGVAHPAGLVKLTEA